MAREAEGDHRDPRGGHLYLDCFSGIAGDMTLGALIDLGVPDQVVRDALAKLPIAGWRLEVGRTIRCGISACDVHVVGEEHERRYEPGHGHRSWREIRGWLDRLDGDAGRRALAIFGRIARAEAKLHGMTEDDVAFHEVGAMDSIVDVVGAAAALAWLAPARVTCRPVPLGHGFVGAAHGRFPVPSPAALEILREGDAPTEDGGAEFELTTPTGAAIAVASAGAFGPPPSGRPVAVGYGAGDRDPPDRPNVLRAIAYEAGSAATAETLLAIEANLDDMNPELTEPLCEALFAAGARDVWVEPITMKKGRPALKLGALCDEARRDAVADAILRESTTIGLRFWPVARRVLERQDVIVPTPYGDVEVKLARDGGRVVNAAPEYESCRAAARRSGAPVKEVYAAAIAAYRGRLAGP